MKTKTLELLRNFQHRLSRSRRWLFVAVITLCLIPLNTRADGIGDILSLFIPSPAPSRARLATH